ncbi:probable aspartic proteinase GIP2 [Cornus florida]|uniref:probable aspartic proteinase GIP2 n=1 Tax=Cornus florida TaxID=4283 RepID=UPI00289F1E23|nr:probable aspartic proteinase GIP2 [Cornus florida]
MASSIELFFFSSLLFSTCISYAQPSFQPKALVLPVSKDTSTLQYVTKMSQRTPLVPVNLVIDLGGRFSWVDCETNYVSSSYRPARCRSAQCYLAESKVCGECHSAGPPRPGCSNNTCILSPGNNVTRTSTDSEVGQDIVSVQSTNGLNPGPTVTVSRFIFSCAPSFLLKGLANGVKGMTGLGRSKIDLLSQFASAFNFSRKFAICLASSSTSNGVMFFGDGPYRLVPNIDASRSLTYTPLLVNSVSTALTYFLGEPSVEYFIEVKSIKMGNKVVPLNKSLLLIDEEGYGGTKISTIDPYTVMETSIYEAFTETFISEAAARNMTRVASVAPFKVCFSSKNVVRTRVGPSVPYIHLVLQSDSVVWTISGANSMVGVSENVLCLGFVDGGLNPRTSIVIGGHQVEDNLLQFDLEKSRLGFSSTLLSRQTTCSNFNFTSSIVA